jgi:ABC-type bacteriocin/lantibiotic exporter with double-glycine peptidase domain
MQITHLSNIILRLTEQIGSPSNELSLHASFSHSMDIDPKNREETISKLSEMASFAGINLIRRKISRADYGFLLKGDFPPHLIIQSDCQVKLFYRRLDELIVYGFPGGIKSIQAVHSPEEILTSIEEDLDEVEIFTAIPIRGLFGDSSPGAHPLLKFFKLLFRERKDIYYILVYALVAGGLSLTLPLGVQTIINFVMSGSIMDTMILMMAAVVLGTLITGGLQILQLILVETLQQRLFARTAFEFAYRIPRIKMESFGKYYPPELMNRFFDVVNVQKGFAKMFTEFSGAVLQAVFGLLLLAFYHPVFILFDLSVLLVVYLIFKILFPLGLKRNLEESTYKYKAAAWVEEMARSLTTFKTAGYSNIAVEKMDYFTQGYLKARRAHFNILKIQFGSMVIFKTLVTGALLILGSLLVVSRDLTLGQFVAAEIVILLIISSIEKVILFLEVIYDTLTGIEKLSAVTDLPLEEGGNLILPVQEKGISLKIKNVSFGYPESKKPILKDIVLEIHPGEKVILTGSPESGKNTLLMVLGGTLTSFEGYMAFNGVSFRDLNLTDLRQNIGFFNRQNDIFEGTLEENLSVNQSRVTITEMLSKSRLAGLDSYLDHLYDGFQTRLPAGGKSLSISIQRRIVIARALLGQPSLILMDEDYAEFVTRKDFAERFDFFAPGNTKTLVAISSDPELMAKADRILWIREGKIYQSGTFAELSQNPEFTQACIVR